MMAAAMLGEVDQRRLDQRASLEADGSALAELPPKRARNKLRNRCGGEEQAGGPTDVRVVDVVRDINVFPPGERPQIEKAVLRVLCAPSSGKGGVKMLYVWEKHLDLLVSMLATLVSRLDVPHVDWPEDSALAEEPQWFDICTSRWNLRNDAGEVVVSDPVPRLGLTLVEFQKAKAAALEALTSRS